METEHPAQSHTARASTEAGESRKTAPNPRTSPHCPHFREERGAVKMSPFREVSECVVFHPLVTTRKILCSQIIHLSQKKEGVGHKGAQACQTHQVGAPFQNIRGQNENSAEAKVSPAPMEGSELTGESLKVHPPHIPPSLKPHKRITFVQSLTHAPQWNTENGCKLPGHRGTLKERRKELKFLEHLLHAFH